MNRKGYNSDPRYAKVLETMDLLGIMDITTTRQDKNGTIVWKLPIKYFYGKRFVEVASFASGYVRNQNGGYTNYQLNKCKPDDRYFKDYRWNEECTEQTWTGKYRKYTGKQRILIPIEIDRLEYLIKYSIKNYYIKNANQVADGAFVQKWDHEWKLEQATNSLKQELEQAKEAIKGVENYYKDKLDSKHVYDCGHHNRIRDLENKLAECLDIVKVEKTLGHE